MEIEVNGNAERNALQHAAEDLDSKPNELQCAQKCGDRVSPAAGTQAMAQTGRRDTCNCVRHCCADVAKQTT